MNLKILAGIVVLIIIIGATAFALTQNSSDNSENQTTDGVFTEAEVATHNDAGDCWTIIDGDVYDLTDFIPRHPGGDEILRACGVDATTLFRERTTETGETIGPGTPHSAVAESELRSLQIGTLAQ